MKLTAFLMIAACIHVSANGFSQNISLSVKQAPLTKVFREIQKQSGYSFWYKTRELDKAAKVTLDLRNATLQEALAKCFENQPFDFVIVEQTVVIRPREAAQPAAPAPPPIIVKGKVTTAAGKPLSGVTVTIKATGKGAITDDNGEFTLSVSKQDVLIFSYVGYDTREVRVGEQTSFAISLTETNTSLNEIAVIGYGSARRKSLASAITTVRNEDLNKGAITDVGQLLQGKVPGLNITASGDPNAPAAVILRGTSTLNGNQTPFYVIDGVPGADISLIAPDDIASLDVLKDAAATAIYGNRAAAGVIIVTTRKGKAGNLQTSYGGYVGTEQVSSRLNVMNASQLRTFLTKNNEGFSPKDDKGANTDWQKAIERTAWSHNHNLSFSGGNEHGSYIASINYANKEGVLNNSDLQRLIARLSVEQYALNDKVKFGLNVINSNSSADDIPYRNTVLLQSALYLPVSPIKNSDGSYFEDFNTSGYYNPVAMMNHSQKNTKTNILMADFTTQVKLPFGLTYDLNLAYMNQSTLLGQYLDSYFTNNYSGMYDNPDPGLAGHQQQTFGTNGQATRQSYSNVNKILETYFTWNRKFGDHSINAVIGYSYQGSVLGDGFQATTYNFPINNIGYNNLAISNPYAYTTPVNFGYDIYSNTRLISDFARLNYNFNDKYLIQGSIRHDGSSVFGANNRWGWFPSVGGAWRISQEGFMRDQQLFTDLKLRASYGVTGNSSGFNALTAQSISGLVGTYYYNGANVAAYGPTQAQNADLRWEKTTTTDIGADFAILNSRITGSIDWYNKITDGMIWNYKVDPILVPTGTIVANGGSMSNKGIELSLTAAVVKNSDFSWTSTLNLAHNTNRITNLKNPLFSGGDSVAAADPEGGGQSGSTVELLKMGHPLGQFYSLEYGGKNSSGISQYVSGSGQGFTTSPAIGTDYHYLGDAQPRIIAGWANTFHYLNWDLNIFLRGTFGNKIFNATRADLFRPATAQYGNILVDAQNESIADINSYKYSSRFIESGSYLRFDNATLGYNFKKVSPYIKKLRAYASVNNLFVITGYKGIDPEVNLGGIAPGVDYNNFYPKTRTVLVGVNVTF